MATFKEIRGQTIKKYTTNPTDPLEGQMWYNNTTGTLKGVVTSSAWSSGSPLSTGRESMGRGGTQTDALVFGGDGDGPTPVFRFNATEEYNGTGWATGGDLPVSINCIAGSSAGSTTAAFGAGGYITAKQSATYEYDGSTWTSGGALGTARSFTPGVGAGTLTAGLVFAGDTYPPASRNSVLTEEYNGASWTAGGVLGSGGYSGMGAGTQTAAVWKGGGPGPTPGTYVSHYNGTSWTEQGAAPFASVSGSYGGPQTSGIASGGIPTPSFGVKSFTYDGSTWTAAPDLAIARYNQGSAGASNTSSLVVGGRGPLSPAFYNFTEEFNTSASVVTAAAWASGGAMSLGRYNGFGYGTQDAAVASSNDGTYVTTTEEYDGASWTGGGALNTGRGGGRAGGTQAAGIVFAGYTGSNSTATETYNGTAYATSPATMATGRRNLASSTNSPAPTATAFGGYVTASSAVTEEFNGTAWATSPGSMSTARYKLGGAGTQTAALAFGGIPAPGGTPQSITEEYNGASWTAGGALGAAVDQITGTGLSTAALAIGGSPALTTTQGYDGTAWSTRPALGTGRGYMMGCGTGTSALGIGGQAPPSGTTATEEFTGETTAANIVTLTTS